MSSARFLSLLVRLHTAVRGRGRLTWACDFGVWDPAAPNPEQDTDSWAAVYESNPLGKDEAVIAHGRTGEEALLALLAKVLRKPDLGNHDGVAASHDHDRAHRADHRGRSHEP